MSSCIPFFAQICISHGAPLALFVVVFVHHKSSLPLQAYCFLKGFILMEDGKGVRIMVHSEASRMRTEER